MEERKLEEKELLTVEEAITLFNLSRGKFKCLIRKVELMLMESSSVSLFGRSLSGI